MARSMTGFGRYETEIDGTKLTVEMRAVNHRFCEILVRLPRHLTVFEEPIKRLIREHIHRGRMEVLITFNANALVTKKLMVDWEMANAYLSYAREVQERFQLPGELSLQDVLVFEHLWHIEENQTEHDDAFESSLMSAVRHALAELAEMRELEGQALITDIKKKMDVIEQLVERIYVQAPRVRDAYGRKLESRLREFLGPDHELDETRLLTEVAIFADKSAIDEELTRLRSHCDQLIKILHQTGAIGRKLDFLIQEMNREVNTIGSKANDIVISQSVVELKSLLEMIKEQVQNLE